MPPRRTLRTALGATVAASAVRYGYTVTLWSSGAVLMHSHGTPSVAEVFAFIAGALTGFGLMGLLARGALAPMRSLDPAVDHVLADVLHWLAVGSAVGAVALIAELHRWEAWPLGSFVATTIYLLGGALPLALVAAGSGRSVRRGERH
jgi:cytochrome c biogenesis protein CcdA